LFIEYSLLHCMMFYVC